MARRSTTAAVLAVAVATAGGGFWWTNDRTPPPRAQSVPTGTSAVLRADLATTIQISGHLQYADQRSLATPGAGGMITGLPRLGQVISRGQTLFEIDGRPVRLGYGRRPEWRSLSVGVTQGADVRQLEQNLVALGFADRRTLTVDTTFSSATAVAVRRWQAATHQARTGEVELGAIVYTSGPVRISGTPVALGGQAQPGVAVLEVTSSTISVAVDVPASETHRVRAGDPVTVTLPAGNSVSGRVQGVSPVADTGSDPSAAAGGGGGDNQAPTTVRAEVRLKNPTGSALLDQAPVTVNVIGRAVHNVVVVPVTALVALAGGNVGVYLRDGGQRKLVAVTPGLYTDTQVELTGNSVHPGQLVEVPAG